MQSPGHPQRYQIAPDFFPSARASERACLPVERAGRRGRRLPGEDHRTWTCDGYQSRSEVPGLCRECHHSMLQLQPLRQHLMYCSIRSYDVQRDYRWSEGPISSCASCFENAIVGQSVIRIVTRRERVVASRAAKFAVYPVDIRISHQRTG